MGVSLLTAMEIYTNPRDLQIFVGQEKEGDKFAIAVLRGQGHNFKPLFSSQPFAETLEDAVVAIKETLESICEIMKRDFADRRSLPSRNLNPDGLEIDQTKVLNMDLIAQIAQRLREHRVANTYEMPTDTAPT